MVGAAAAIRRKLRLSSLYWVNPAGVAGRQRDARLLPRIKPPRLPVAKPFQRRRTIVCKISPPQEYALIFVSLGIFVLVPIRPAAPLHMTEYQYTLARAARWRRRERASGEYNRKARKTPALWPDTRSIISRPQIIEFVLWPGILSQSLGVKLSWSTVSDACCCCGCRAVLTAVSVVCLMQEVIEVVAAERLTAKYKIRIPDPKQI